MDAYDIYNKLKDYWGSLVTLPSAGDLKKVYPAVPVHVIVNGQEVTVCDVLLTDGKIVLITK
jgi:hypothetical protein